MSIKNLMATFFLFVIPILWAAFGPVIDTSTFRYIVASMIFLAPLAIAMKIGAKGITAFVELFFTWELAFLLIAALLAPISTVPPNQLTFGMAATAVFVSPICLILSLMSMAALHGESSHDSGWEKGEHHHWDRYGKFEAGDKTLIEERFERQERERWVNELRERENERYQDS